jgi:precorrin-6A synthase
MRELLIIGIGAGHVDHVTVQAVKALRRLDVVFVVEKAGDTQDLVIVREEILAAHVPDGGFRTVRMQDPPRGRGPAAVAAWRAARAAQWAALLEHELAEDEVGGFLVWGDPSLYDSTIDVVRAIEGRVAFTWSVLAGISAPHALTAAHRITLNRVGGAVQVTTGRRLAAEGLPEGVGDVVVMLDPDCAFTALAGVEIYWGAYLGTRDELLVRGPLPEVAEEVVRVRAAARERKGWMFDTYLLRR